jgi:hypothetical protein
MATQSSKYGTLNFEGNPVSVLSTGEGASYGISYQDSSGKQYYFVPDTLINTGTSGTENSYFFPFFLNKDNLSNFFNKAEPVNLLDLPYGQAAANAANVNTTGYLVPASVGFDSTQAIVVPKSQGNITGIAQKDGKLVYATTGGAGNAYGWVESSGTGYMQPQAERKYGWLGDLAGGITDVLQGLGPITPIVLNAIAPGAGTGYAIGTTIGSGGDVGDVLKSVAISQGLSALGNAAVPSTAGTDTAFLQDMDQGIFTDTTLDPAFVQDMSQGIEPLTPVVPDTAFLQDMDQGITPEVNLEGGDLGMTEAEAQDQYYRDIGLDPSTVVDTPAVPTTGDTPAVPTQATPSLTPQQAYQLLKLGAGLFGGGAVAQAAQGLMGGGTGGGMALPTIQAPTPFTGTYSGMNMNDPAYYQQVQQNYNRLFPTTPANVAGPLESWYQTKYVPDTTISNKLFGV